MAIRDWLTGTAVVALMGVASPAWASNEEASTANDEAAAAADQETPTTTDQDISTQEDAQPDAAESDSDGGLGDITVTATRRSERLQNVPISITALDAAQLERTGITNTLQLTQTVPALNVRYVNFSVQPIIRGVGTRGTTNGDEANVAFYVDGIYQVAPSASSFDLLNIERVEVLRGPQGTLFGRNATGGLINIITRDPSHDTQVEAVLNYGRFNERSADIYATTGLTDTLAFDVSGRVYEDDGFVRDILRDRRVAERRTYSARSRLFFTPTDDISLRLTGSYSKYDDASGVYVLPYMGNTAARSLANNPFTVIPTKPFTTAPTDPSQILRARTHQVAADFRWDVGPVTLQNSASYLKSTGDFRGDNDGTPVDLGQNEAFDQGSRSYQNEFRILSNNDSNFSYILGAYYLDSKSFSGPIFVLPAGSGIAVGPSTIILDTQTRTYSIAGFGEGTLTFGDWKVIAGLRYTDEKREMKGASIRNGVTLSSNDLEASFNKWTYRAIVQRELGSFGNVFASYSRGFKSGVFNASNTSPAAKPTRPEVLDAFEIGLKSDPLPWLRANASVFHYDYKDIQLSSRDPSSSLVVLFNAANAKIDGGELELTARPVRDLNLRGYVNYLDAKYTNFPGAQIFNPVFQDQSGIGLGSMVPIGNVQSISDESGSRLIRAPKYTFGGSFDYTMRAAVGDFGITGNLFHSGKFFWDVNNRTFQPAYTIVNGEISWTMPDGRLRFAIWGRNLTDEKIQAQLNPSAAQDGVSYERPISYGISARLSL